MKLYLFLIAESLCYVIGQNLLKFVIICLSYGRIQSWQKHSDDRTMETEAEESKNRH